MQTRNSTRYSGRSALGRSRGGQGFGPEPAELPPNWRIRPLESVVSKIKAGGTPKRSEPAYWGGEILFAKIADITQSNGYLNKTSESITEAGLENSSAWLVPRGAVVLTMYGSIGATALLKKEMATNQAIIALITHDDIDAEFLLYSLTLWARDMERLNIQSTQKNVNAGIVKQFPIAVPPLSEQRAISHVLRTVQRAREQTDHVIAAARELKQSLMRHLFTYGPVVATGTDAFRAAKAPAEAWPVNELGTLVEKPQYGYTASAVDDPIGPRFLRITDIQDGRVDWNHVPWCECERGERGQFRLYPGDLVVARIGATTGKTWLVSDLPEETVFASYLIRIRTPEGLRPAYLAYFTQSEHYWSQINVEKGGRLRTGVNVSTLKGLRIPLASMKEQQEIVKMLSAVDTKIEAEEQRRDTLDALFDSLLHGLMTARLRVGHLAAELV